MLTSCYVLRSSLRHSDALATALSSTAFDCVAVTNAHVILTKFWALKCLIFCAVAFVHIPNSDLKSSGCSINANAHTEFAISCGLKSRARARAARDSAIKSNASGKPAIAKAHATLVSICVLESSIRCSAYLAVVAHVVGSD
eukprot:gnl/MRDRNA2_/MRDRNA2_211227_c0_seq1.p1 gnl/MRDRNA2_/MRDRNA2_211227_c0~~gnl/MRDRNA2_/MRDRNA2_211227_c0_seq1.p1  ORF type:complete len:142 (+),score=9.44 gnl/MRDRNA2_/MRDRNA2_211227_c0_seq1:64-489(+)